MNKPTAFAAVLMGLSSGVGYSQTSMLSQFNPLNSDSPGIQLFDVSVSSSYYSYGAGQASMAPSTAATQMWATDVSAALGWSRRSQKNSISIKYTPSYVHGVRQTSYQSLNHSLSLFANRSFNSKWSVVGSGSLLVSDLNSLLFGSTASMGYSAAPATFDQLVASMLTGSSNNLTLTQIADTASLISSPSSAVAYGGRELSASVSTSLAYAYSSRSSVSVSLGGSRTQFLSAASNAGADSYTPVLPDTTSGHVDAGWSYSLTPRTSISADASLSRTISKYQDAYTTQLSVSVGRKISNHWYLQGMAGVGSIRPLRITYAVDQNAQRVLGSSLIYKLDTQTFVGSYSRALSDVYGLGANATETASGGWTWRPMRSRYSLSAGVGHSRLIGAAFANTPSWNGNASLSLQLTEHMLFGVAASYAQLPQYLTLLAPNLSLTGVMGRISWSPSTLRHASIAEGSSSR